MIILDRKGIEKMIWREQGKPLTDDILYVLPIVNPTPVWRGGTGWGGWYLVNTFGSHDDLPSCGFDCKVDDLPEFGKGKEMWGGWVFRTKGEAIKAARAYEVAYAKYLGKTIGNKSVLYLVVLDWPGIFLAPEGGGGEWVRYYLRQMKSAWRKWKKIEDARARGENVEQYIPPVEK